MLTRIAIFSFLRLKSEIDLKRSPKLFFFSVQGFLSFFKQFPGGRFIISRNTEALGLSLLIGN